MPADRIRSLDTLRGLMLVVMTVDHLDLYGPIYRLTYETFGFASAAEGFVLVSGIVAGVVYGRYAEISGRLGAAVKRRLVTLYSYHLVIAAGLLGFWLAYPGERPEGGVAAACVQSAAGAVLLNQEPPLDILVLYLLFVALLPLILGGFRRGHAPAVLAASAALWCLDQVLTPLAGYPPEIRFALGGVPIVLYPNHFHLLAWQFLFVAGAWIGWWWPRGARRLGRGHVAGSLAVVAVCFALRHGTLLPEIDRASLVAARVNLGILRLINLTALVVAIGGVGQAWPRVLRSRWLELLGRHALVVFTWQTLLQLALGPLYLEAAQRWGPGARLLLVALAVVSLTLPAWYRDSRKPVAAGDRGPWSGRRR